MRRIIGLMAAIVILAATHTPARAAEGEVHANSAPYTNCDPVGHIRFVCLGTDPEDLARIPDTDWVVTSAFSGTVGLRLVSVRAQKEVAVLYPSPEARKKQDMATYGGCPGPLDAKGEATFVAHGLALRKVTDRLSTLYVVHHGARESIEVFNLEVSGGKRPLVTWVGCVLYPDRGVGNAVAALPDGGLVATYFREGREGWKVGVNEFTREIFGDPLTGSVEPGEREKVAAGQNTGYVLEWQPHSGWAKLPDSDATSPNGIEVSGDGKQVYVLVASGGGTLLRISRGANPPKRDEVSLRIRGDNVKWTADGKKLLIGGGPKGASDPGRNVGNVIEIDPDTLQMTDLIESPVATVTTGYQVGKDIWCVSGSINRIAIFPMQADETH
jgi:hypothetical protein